MPEKMDLQKAFGLFELLGNRFVGTRVDHQNIQAALIVIKRELFGQEQIAAKLETENGTEIKVKGSG